jgi:hypothetical protein
MGIKLGDNLDHYVNVIVYRRNIRRWVFATAFVCSFISIGIGYWWAYNSSHCNQKLIPDGVTCYHKNGVHVERVTP